MVKDWNGSPEGLKERAMHAFETEYQAFVCTKGLKVCTCDLRRRDFIHALVSETTIPFQRKVLTWDGFLKVVD